jgi:hypothetical protein
VCEIGPRASGPIGATPTDLLGSLSSALRHLVTALLLCPLLAAAGELSPEAQLAMQSLKPGERDKLFKAIGPIDEAPLYRGDLEVDPEKRTATGRLSVTFTPKKLTEFLDLRVTPNAVEKSRVKISHATQGGRPVITEQPEPTLFRIKLDPPAPKGVPVAVEFRVTGKLPEAPPMSDQMLANPGAGAQGKADHGAFMAAPEVVNLSGLIPGIPPVLAPGAPAMSGPSGIGDLSLFDPAHYLVTVLVPRGWAVVAPGVALGEVPESDGRNRFTFGISAARDFAVFLTKGYQVDSILVDGITVESHFLPQDKQAGARAGKYAAAALAEFQKRISPYPWTTFRVVQTRLIAGAGGMEFPALVAISTGLYRGAADPLAALGLPGMGDVPFLSAMVADLKPMMEQTLEFTIAHEVGHQWFPMMVGSDPIEEPVVDEALTQHVALLYMEWKHGRKSADGMRDVQLKLSYQFHRMMGGDDGAALRPTRLFPTMGEYAALVYGKGPLLFDDQRKLAGDAGFFSALRTYADSFRWHWAGPKSFTEVLATKVPKHKATFEELRKRYWLEAHGDDDIGQKGVMSQLPPGAAQLMQSFNPNGPSQQLDAEQQKMLEEALKVLQGEQ